MKAYRGRSGALHSVWVPSLDGGKLSVFWKRSRYPLNTKLNGPQTRSGHFREDKNHYPLPDRPAPSPVTNPLTEREVQNSFNTVWQKCSWVTCMWLTEWEQTFCSVLCVRKCRVLLCVGIRIQPQLGLVDIRILPSTIIYFHANFSEQNRSVCLSVCLSVCQATVVRAECACVSVKHMFVIFT